MRAKFRDLPERLQPFTVRNVADGFDVHPQTVRRWARAGVLACHKAGPRNHKLWFTEADIRAFLHTPKGIRNAWRAS
jgi:DNA-binding transcriptional MerR regulator